MIVVDTNVIAYFFIAGSFTGLAEAAFVKDHWCAPMLWRSEYRNVLTTHLRNGLRTADEVRDLMARAERLMWGREFTVRSSAVLDCIAGSRRSAYDCEFIALAQELDIRLITTDEPVIQEFPKIAIHLREYVARF